MRRGSFERRSFARPHSASTAQSVGALSLPARSANIADPASVEQAKRDADFRSWELNEALPILR